MAGSIDAAVQTLSQVIYGASHDDRAGMNAAPSRPPSRISTHGDITDLTSLHAEADPTTRFTEDEKNDPHLQEALRLSMEGQETGVTRSGQSFHKVQDSDYRDPAQWAVTVSREINRTPPPGERRRRWAEPAFLNGPSSDNYLGALLTIYHTIPLAKEALLKRDFRRNDYEHDTQWWKGAQIGEKILGLSDEEEGLNDRRRAIHELQRLMAFLDDTIRAYGSTESLANLPAMKEISAGSDDPFADSDIYKILALWRTTVASSDASMDMRPSVFESSATIAPSFRKPFNFITREKTRTSTGVEGTLYDEVDAFLWKDRPGSALDDIWIDQLAEVVTFRFDSGTDDGIGFGIPAVWYPDKYLYESRERSRKDRETALAMVEEIHKLEDEKNSTLYHTATDGKSRDVRKHLMATAAAAEATVTNSALQVNGVSEDHHESKFSKVSLQEADACIKQLKAMVERIDNKVEALDRRRKDVLEALKEQKRQPSQPMNSSNAPLTHKYTLRGVSTHPHVTYILWRKEQDTPCSSPSSEIPPDREDEWQWWRTSYSRQDGKLQHDQVLREGHENGATTVNPADLSRLDPDDIVGYTSRRVSEDEVLMAARQENNSVLLVYASEDAVNYPLQPVPKALSDFVMKDNDFFQNVELLGGTLGPTTNLRPFDNDFADDIEAQPLIPAVESDLEGQTSMSTSSFGNSIPRGYDGQASPKRAKAYEENGFGETDEIMREGGDVQEMTEKSGAGMLGLGRRPVPRPSNRESQGNGLEGKGEEGPQSSHVESLG
ncbi:MAG: hypothetical protein Q9227_008399 [Pyrenula ochraceoflavens]